MVGELRFGGMEGGSQEVVTVGGGVVEVEESDAVGMFGLRGADQPPDGRVGEVRRRGGRGGLTGDDGQVSVGELVCCQKLLGKARVLVVRVCARGTGSIPGSETSPDTMRAIWSGTAVPPAMAVRKAAKSG